MVTDFKTGLNTNKQIGKFVFEPCIIKNFKCCFGMSLAKFGWAFGIRVELQEELFNAIKFFASAGWITIGCVVWKITHEKSLFIDRPS